MTAVVRHFLPDVPIEKDALREAVAGFPDAPEAAIDKCGEARQEPDPTTRGGDMSTEDAIRVDSPAAYITPSSQMLPTIESPNAEQLLPSMAYPSPELSMVCDQGDDRLNCDSMGIPRGCYAARYK